MVTHSLIRNISLPTGSRQGPWQPADAGKRRGAQSAVESQSLSGQRTLSDRNRGSGRISVPRHSSAIVHPSGALSPFAPLAAARVAHLGLPRPVVGGFRTVRLSCRRSETAGALRGGGPEASARAGADATHDSQQETVDRRTMVSRTFLEGGRWTAWPSDNERGAALDRGFERDG
jgi:hypothetical protein